MTTTTQLKAHLATPSKNSYVYKLGFRHAIMWYKHSWEVEQHIAKTFGDPAKGYHYTNYRGNILARAQYNSENPKRWFYGPQRWNNSNRAHAHWAVFRTERDRTLALLTL
jgi:hypothetical protein